jgi:GTP cyclohydrolase I
MRRPETVRRRRSGGDGARRPGEDGSRAAIGEGLPRAAREDVALPSHVVEPLRGADEIEAGVERLLALIGENPTREGLRRTPRRVAEAVRALTRGYAQDVEQVLNGAVFETTYDEMVIVKDIDFFSLCEHHLLPFFGKAHVAYLPAGKILGLSKLSRVVEVFSRRLQVQEQMTSQVADTLQRALQPKGVGVVVEAQHLCMMMRGVEKQNAFAITSALTGRFKSDARSRSEFLELIRQRRG